MEKRKYDSTIARIAGNLLSGREPHSESQLSYGDEASVRWAVKMARAIVAEVQQTEAPQQ